MADTESILVVDDDVELCELLKDTSARRGTTSRVRMTGPRVSRVRFAMPMI